MRDGRPPDGARGRDPPAWSDAHVAGCSMVALAVLLVGTGLEVVATQWRLAGTGRVYAARARDLGRCGPPIWPCMRPSAAAATGS